MREDTKGGMGGGKLGRATTRVAPTGEGEEFVRVRGQREGRFEGYAGGTGGSRTAPTGREGKGRGREKGSCMREDTGGEV